LLSVSGVILSDLVQQKKNASEIAGETHSEEAWTNGFQFQRIFL
jgi:hypothetical protein